MSEHKLKEFMMPLPSAPITFQPKWPLRIIIDGIGTLDPKDDITPKESVLLSMMLACGATSSLGIDYASFVKENRLERHFRGADRVDPTRPPNQ